MSRPVLPEPAGASTMKERWMSRAWRRASASGGAGVGSSRCAGSLKRGRKGRTLAKVGLRGGWVGQVGLGIEVEVFQGVGVELEGIQTAEQALVAVLAGLRILLGRDAGFAGVEVFGERGEDVTPLMDLRLEAVGLKLGGLGQDAVVGLAAVDAHVLAAADAGEGDGGESRSGGDDGVERELRCVWARGEPVGGVGWAGLVVEDDFARRLAGVAFSECKVDAVDANVEAK